MEKQLRRNDSEVQEPLHGDTVPGSMYASRNDDPYLVPPPPICNLYGRDNKKLVPGEIALFTDIMYGYYQEHGRSFHWRETCDPYKILLSELMLQQTQTERVTPKYLAFIREWPDFQSLAAASFPEVLRLWRGLGYNRRAIALKDIAVRVTRDYNGRLPNTYDELINLPMVGPATAAAILAFAHGKASLYLETNIRRVLIYFFFDQAERIRDRDLYDVLEDILDKKDPGKWYYALMDFGVFLKQKVKNPNRRSAHYTRQPAFEKSNRQVRGQILTILTEQGKTGVSRLLRQLDFPEKQVDAALQALVSEKFLVCENRLLHDSEPEYTVNTYQEK